MVFQMLRYYASDKAASYDSDDYGMGNDIVDGKSDPQPEREGCIFLGESSPLKLGEKHDNSIVVLDDRCEPIIQHRDDFNVFESEIKYMFRSSQDAVVNVERCLDAPDGHEETIDLIDHDCVLHASKSLDWTSKAYPNRNPRKNLINLREKRESVVPVDASSLHEPSSRAMKLRRRIRQLESQEHSSSKLLNTGVSSTTSPRSTTLRQRKRDIERRYFSFGCGLMCTTF